MRYARPDIGENALAYKGRRCWAIAIKSDGEFEDIDSSLADYVLWDCLDGGSIAVIKDSQDKKYIGEIIAHVEMDRHEYSSLREAVIGLEKEYDWYATFEDCVEVARAIKELCS
jgi:hypothetical protein